MQLNTITDFDFGIGGNVNVSPSTRVGQAPNDVTKLDVKFILWLLLEQEIRRGMGVVKLIEGGGGRFPPPLSRTQHDGGRGANNGQSIPRRLLPRLDPTTERIARQHAEESLREAGIDTLLDDLPEEYRTELLLQLCRNTELLRCDSIKTVPEIFHALRSSSKFQNEFDITGQLGEGRFGEVFQVRMKGVSSAEFAVKKIMVSFDTLQEDVQMAINESNVLKHLKGHPNIVEIYDCWLELEQSAGNELLAYNEEEEYFGGLKFYIQLELCSFSLETWNKDNRSKQVSLEPQQILSIARDISDGLAHIHGHNIIHLDINPRNIVWASPACTRLKIVDYGFAVSGSTCDYRRGTPGYAAPEERLTSKSDIYSAAVTIIEKARTIFTQSELDHVIQNKVAGIGIPVLDELLSLSLDDDPAKRPTAETIKDQVSLLLM